MLVQLTTTKGQPIWVNPIHVRAVRAKPRHTEVVIPNNSPMGQSIVKVQGAVEDVVAALNAGMPEIMPSLPLDEETGGGGYAGGAAAAGLMG